MCKDSVVDLHCVTVFIAAYLIRYSKTKLINREEKMMEFFRIHSILFYRIHSKIISLESYSTDYKNGKID